MLDIIYDVAPREDVLGYMLGLILESPLERQIYMDFYRLEKKDRLIA